MATRNIICRRATSAMACIHTLQNKESEMDFIERMFGISPDGGTGALEALYFIAVFVTLAVACWRQRRAQT